MIERGREEKKKKKRVINQFKEDRSNFKEVVAPLLFTWLFLKEEASCIPGGEGSSLSINRSILLSPAFANNTMMEKK